MNNYRISITEELFLNEISNSQGLAEQEMGNALKQPLKHIRRNQNCKTVSKKKAVVITGCDSGLGFSLSLKFNEMGLTVISGCLNNSSEGAKILRNKCHVLELDVTDSKSIENFKEKVITLTKDNNAELHSVINNAGVMIFGEFGWYTEKQILHQVQVNFLGSLLVSKAFLPFLRKNRGRLINVTSHCALTNLPTLSVYGATKAAIQSWSHGLRIEEKKYGVKVITFLPGSFASQSNIMAQQKSHFKQMKDAFTENEKKTYSPFFENLSAYLGQVLGGEKTALSPIKDEVLYKKFIEAVLYENPKSSYKHEPWKYFIYYNLFRLPFITFRDYLIWKFLAFPDMKKNRKNIIDKIA